MVHRTARYWAAILIALFLLPLVAIAGPSQGPSATIDPLVLQQTAAGNQATFWVILRQKADLSPAYTMKNWAARGQFVVQRLQAAANASQAGIRSLLQSRGVPNRPFWVVNTIRVRADSATVKALAARPEVEQIVPDRTYQIPTPRAGKDQARVNSVEWGIDRINAPQVWSTFGDRGENIVVANIDTGVQFDHPALVRQYRGNLGNGSFDHNYNWFDPSNVCGTPAPCDNVAHGTHTMGTMVGDDGDPGANQIGVAPHARWIAAKGCESNSCSTEALLASGQWVLAPTDLSGNNPRPDLRPNVVNNSWGDGPNDPFYESTVQAWIASGLFPAFANGNAGPGCGTAGVPGAYPESYGVGAFDINNNIASFSSRGPSAVDGGIKPNIAAPGVNVRSSVPGSGYDSFSGTSMATPHLAGTVALIWSAAPSLIGDIAGTRALLDQTAIDTSDLSCGGTAGNNNVWGEGRLDAFAAVNAAPRGPTGTLQGVVTNASSNPIAGATVHAAGPTDRTTTTDASGAYSMVLPVGSYDVTASAFGYASQTAHGVAISDGGTTTQNFALNAVPSHSVSGHVRDSDNNAVANATVTILNTPIPPATTDANGAYSFASVPEGTYDVRAAAGGCNDAQTQSLLVNGNETLDFTLPQRHDNFGYFCQVVSPSYIEGDTALGLSGDDNAVQLNLPFTFTFYGQSYNSASVATNGYLNFLALNSIFSNSSIPSAADPNGAIYPFWDDLFLDGASSTWTKLIGSAPNRQLVIEWRNASFFSGAGRIDFEVVLYENGRILTQYRNIDNDGQEQGNSATLGIENAAGDDALQYSFNEAAIASPQFAVLYRLPPSGFIQGHVTDANDHLPVSATVKALQNGQPVRTAATDSNGFYRMQVPVGTYTVEASASNYATGSAQASVAEDQTVTRDFALATARAEVSPTALEFIVPPNQIRTKTLTLRNTGSLNMTWEIRETGGNKVKTSSTLGLAKNPSYNPNARTTNGLYTAGTPAGWSPTAPGDVIRSWSTVPLELAWGVGYSGNVWLSDVDSGSCAAACQNYEYTPAGAQTGRHWATSWSGAWPGDMAFDAGRGAMCQVNVGGDNGIYCWNPSNGNVVGSITSGPWTSISQRGLAYRPDDDTFYIGGWNEGILYHVKGLSYPDKGTVISQCSPADGNISGLAWNPAFNIIWEASNSPTDTIYELNPDTCAVLATLPHPNPGFNGAGLEMDEAGNLWMISQNSHLAYLIDSGVPAFTDVPWLSENPSSGTLAAGGTQNIAVRVDTTGLAPGVYNASLFLNSNSGRNPVLRIPVNLIVPGYQQGVNTGGKAYTDRAGDLWAADRAYSAGSYGYVGQSNTASTKSAIAGTDDDPLYQDARRGAMEYRFDGLAPGVYQVDLRFAEIQGKKPGQRIFDVLVEGAMLLPALDISSEVGQNKADDRSFFLVVTDGQVNIRFVQRRSFGEPIINAIRVTHRPDK